MGALHKAPGQRGILRGGGRGEEEEEEELFGFIGYTHTLSQQVSDTGCAMSLPVTQLQRLSTSYNG